MLVAKRVYEPAAKGDGYRVLVDRLWPRGVSKAKAKVDLWAKEAAPTSDLREWFHGDPERRYKEFAKKYGSELTKNPAAKELRKALHTRTGRVTLLTAAKEVEHSHVPILLRYLKR